MPAAPVPVSPAFRAILTRWYRQARAVLTDPDSTESQRRLAWRFLKTWGAR